MVRGAIWPIFPADEVRRRLGVPMRLLVLLAILTLVRLVAAATVPMTEDEAYYRLWSQSIDFGYFDHPPMVAWWIAAGRSVFGDTPLGSRLLAVAATTFTSLLIYGIARECRLSVATSSMAAIWYNATLLVGFGGQLIVPDGPSTFFWTLTLFCLLRARDASPVWWLAAGTSAGLAVLSKYSALFIAPGCLLWLMCSQDGRRRLSTPWPWLCATCATAIASTNLMWNAAHHWVSFQKQFGRAMPDQLTLRYAAELIASQAVLLNPLMTPLAITGVGLGLQRRTRALDGLWMLTAFILPFAAYLAVHSLHARVQGHWPAPLYPGLSVLAAASAHGPGRWKEICRKGLAPAGAVIAGAVLLHLMWPATDWFGRLGLTGQLRDWPRFARSVERARVESGAAWVGSLSFGQAALLENTRQIHAPVLQITERARYALSPPPPTAALAQPGLIVDLSRRVTAGDLLVCFRIVTPLGQIERGLPSTVPVALRRFGLGPRHYTYALFRVDGAKTDLVRDGCWEAKTLADSLRATSKRARGATK
jgi:4-amino-4-deoxy-L-arabinose transferase-like glycosyltransferase